MELNAETITALTSAIGSCLASAVGYGVMKQKVDRVEKDVADCVRREVFVETITSLRSDLLEMKGDLKELLRRKE